MNLRERGTIRPPRRYDDEAFVATALMSGSTPQPEERREMTPPPRQRLIMPACARPAFPPPYVDYDPNRPPAAFPTLENPIPGSVKQKQEREAELEKRSKEQGTSIQMARATVNGGHLDTDALRDNVEGIEDMDVDIDDKDTPEPEEDDVPDMCDMETSDEDEGEYGINPARFRHVRWGDLSPILQCEIIENLLSVYQWAYIDTLLHLSPEEKAAATDHALKRKIQAQHEERKLGEMRGKQLKALLRIDNSLLKKSHVPYQLVFRNFSKQYVKDARAPANADYLMSTAKEVIAARCYLRRIGLDPKFAGEWRNELAMIQQPSGANPNEVEELRWTLDSNNANTVPQDTVAAIGTQASHVRNASRRKGSTKPKRAGGTSKETPTVRFINHVGSQGAVVPLSSAEREREKHYRASISGAKTATKILEKNTPRVSVRPQSPNTTGTSDSGEKVVRVKIGPEGAARVDNMTETSTPDTHRDPSTPQLSSSRSVLPSKRNPLSTNVQSDPPSGGRTKTSFTKTKLNRHKYSAEHEQKTEKPLERALSGAWWYDGKTPKPVDSTMTHDSSKNIQEKLLAARAETEIRQLARSGGQRRLTAESRLAQLPIRSSPLKQMSFCHSDSSERPTTPHVLSSDDPPMISSPIKRSASGRSKPQARLAMQVCPEPVDDAMEKNEHGPPYSPISPPKTVVDAPNPHVAITQVSSTKYDHVKINETSSIISHETIPTPRGSDASSNRDRSETLEAESGREEMDISFSVQGSEGYGTETISNVMVATQVTGQSPCPNSTEQSEENSQFSDVQGNTPSNASSLSGSQPANKTKKRTGKASGVSRKRKSARLNPPETRSLRPLKSNVQYKF